MSEAHDYVKNGQFFKAMTVKGAWTFLFCKLVQGDPNVYMVHAGRHKTTGGARVTKHSIEQTIRAIEAGDLIPIPKSEADLEKFIPASIGLTAMGKGMRGEQYMNEITGGRFDDDE